MVARPRQTTKGAAPPMHRQFKDDDFQFGFEIALGATYRQSADAGEVLATVARIKNGDKDGWVAAWLETAERVLADAQAADDAGRRVTALAAYRRAATYFSTALYQITGSKQSDRRDELWRRQNGCWERIVELGGGERIDVPYEGTTLPAWFFRAPDAAPGERRPLVVMNNGSDGASATMWPQGGAAAAERGWHWLTFEGPGQQSTLFEQGIPFRPDWEAVLTPVLDALLARADVDPARVAVIGISQAGYWVPRALAFEHRFAAAVIDPGVVDVSASWTEKLSGAMRKDLEHEDEKGQKHFDRNIGYAEKFMSGMRATLDFRAEPYGLESGSRYELYEEILKYKLGDEVAQIRTPVLITDPEDEQFWPGQSQELFERLPAALDKTLVRFTAAEGAHRHCEPLAGGLRDQRVFGWLEERLG